MEKKYNIDKLYTIRAVEVRLNTDRSDEPYPDRPKLHVFIHRESIKDNLIGRHMRPYSEYKKLVIPAAVAYLKQHNPKFFNLIKNYKWSWRSRCGCYCPCSPGFVALAEHGTADIYVTVEPRKTRQS